MLQLLYIQNYAIIEQLTLGFSPQLNIITGETGAGKSILMGALSLILGGRADSSVLRNTDQKCYAEGIFSIDEKPEVIAFLRANELEFDKELVVRREIAASGKSRAFINDTPVTIQQLKELASMLVDLHQQFDTLELGNAGFQRMVLDAMANQLPLLQLYRLQFNQWQKAAEELEELRNQKAGFNKELDYNRFLYDELEEAALAENEMEELDKELQLLSNAEDIKNVLSRLHFDLKESETPIVSSLKQMANQLQQYQSFHAQLPGLSARLQSAQIELLDIANELSGVSDAITSDPQRLNWINDRLAIGYKLFKKHNVLTTAELLAIQNNLQQKMQAVLNIDEAIAEKESATAQLYQQALEIAQQLSTARHQQAPELEQQVNQLLAQIGMPNARLKAAITESPLQADGIDAIEFLFDANKSNRFEPVRKVASGGELSRLMLCIKSLVARSIDLPTMIFDEIDTGISGEASKQVGIIMKNLASQRQVIAITHQPQIAGKADRHFYVYKEPVGETVKTNIRILSQEERINAIAQMLGGEKPTAAALENAREMVIG
ncbi:DNA repair protein RecN (Recombination protein N) [Filimonas zeae]|uniref:DNA repair protein RecN n=1 Tax=Filimonas zeae TaxID=1737353 RepID=A0A917J291_9BACT|nr:DNA repair protein RecN [Filimonas zeae]MDR6342102.1 DNA repair protein RecN (Recombination protein N) [Filimonas zeae]GGH79102.1 DNA repair protein RecN [Filimonas zeae]